MQCLKCDKDAVITLQHGALCPSHFLAYFEKKVFKTISKYNLVTSTDRVCVAASGGKDSLTVLYLLKKYAEQHRYPPPQALIINEGIAGYRDGTIKDLELFCNEHNVPLHKKSFKKQFGKDLDEAYPIINSKTKKKPCNICGVWRRYLINKGAKELDATVLATGHNLDDEAQAVMMNIMKANHALLPKLGPKSGTGTHKDFVQRVKPLYFCSEKETRLYTLLKKFKVAYTECPNVVQSYRADVRDVLNQMEEKYPGTKTAVINSFLHISKLYPVQENVNIGSCTICNEPSNKNVCNACTLEGML